MILKTAKEIYISKNMSNNLQINDIKELISLDDKEVQQLKCDAYKLTEKHLGRSIYLRGLVEFSNICEFDCFYCGLRKSNGNIKRFFASEEDILEYAKICNDNGLGSIVLQSGQNSSEPFISKVERVIKLIKNATKSEVLPNGLGITLSAGEQKHETYKRWFEAGAHRYLLRIETTNEYLFRQIHPPNQTFQSRIKALENLDRIGYQVGTGIMLGLPGQTISDLANDIYFMKDFGIDMIGMGPYNINDETPMSSYSKWWESRKDEIIRLSLKMIAAARLAMVDVNIASTTALAVLSGRSKIEAIEYGANVIMPRITNENHRKQYYLYRLLGNTDVFNDDYINEINKKLEKINRKIALNTWGDAPHYFMKQDKNEA